MITYRFPKKLRLIKTDEFSSVFNFRKRISGRFLALHYLPNQLDWSRLGLVVAKKSVRSSVDRNYIRRVIRELFRLSQHNLQRVDLIVRVQRAFYPSDYDLIETEFNRLVEKIAHLDKQLEKQKIVVN